MASVLDIPRGLDIPIHQIDNLRVVDMQCHIQDCTFMYIGGKHQKKAAHPNGLGRDRPGCRPDTLSARKLQRISIY